MPKSILVASCSFDLNATSSQLVLVPEGTFRGVDGRPFDAPHWELTPERGQQIVAALNQRQVDMVIDYEHATLKAQETGEPAPASGWLKAASFHTLRELEYVALNLNGLIELKAILSRKNTSIYHPFFLYQNW